MTARDTAERVVVDEHEIAPGPDPRLLLTNDDGIDSPGLQQLAMRLGRDFDVVVAAPDRDMSGSGTGIGRFDPRRGVNLTRVELGDVEAYTLAGPPGLAVMAGALGAFGRSPDLVVSGVNAGLNTGHSVIHSGTVGAVLTARTFGSHGLAVSLAPSEPWHWSTAVEIAREAVDWILALHRHRVVLNLNVPATPLSEVKGARWADLDDFGYFRVAMADIPGEKLQFEVAGSGAGLDPGCDTALCLDGYATLTPLSTIEPAPFPPEDAGALWRPNGRS